MKRLATYLLFSALFGAQLSCASDPGQISVSMTYGTGAEALAADVRSFFFIVVSESEGGQSGLTGYPPSCLQTDGAGNTVCIVRDCSEFDPATSSSFDLDLVFGIVPEGEPFFLEACGLGDPTGTSPDILVRGASQEIANSSDVSADIQLAPYSPTEGGACADLPEYCE